MAMTSLAQLMCMTTVCEEGADSDDLVIAHFPLLVDEIREDVEKKKKSRESGNVVVHVPATWKGIQVIEALEKEGIKCCAIEVFSLVQAAAAAEAGASYISPRVSRLLTWMKDNTKGSDFTEPADDPGVQLVKTIHDYLKRWGLSSVLMPGDISSVEEALELGGVDRLLLPPRLIRELETMETKVERRLGTTGCCNHVKMHSHDHTHVDLRIAVDEASFRQRLAENRMATDLLMPFE